MLLDRLGASYRFGGHSSDWILPLHSSVASTDQKKVFLRPPENIRKVTFFHQLLLILFHLCTYLFNYFCYNALIFCTVAYMDTMICAFVGMNIQTSWKLNYAFYS